MSHGAGVKNWNASDELPFIISSYVLLHFAHTFSNKIGQIFFVLLFNPAKAISSLSFFSIVGI